MEGFIKIHRKLLEWEWSDSPNVLSAFIHCLLMANWKDKEWRGDTIKRGSFVTSIAKFGAKTGLTTKQTRLALDKLKRTNEINIIGTSQFTVIEVVKYDEYQLALSEEGKQKANEGQTEGKQRANKGQQLKNSKKNKNNKKEEEDLFREETSSSLPDKSGSDKSPPFPYDEFLSLWHEGYESVVGRKCRAKFTEEIKSRVRTLRKGGYEMEDFYHAMKMLLLTGERDDYHRRTKWRNFSLLHLFTQRNFARYAQATEDDYQTTGLSPIFEQAMKNLGL